MISDKKNLSISGALRQQGLLIISSESHFYRKLIEEKLTWTWNRK